MSLSTFAQTLQLQLEWNNAKHNMVDGKTPFEYNVTLRHGQTGQTYTTKYTKGAAHVRYGRSPEMIPYKRLFDIIQMGKPGKIFLHPIPPSLDEVLESLQSDCQAFDNNPLWSDFAAQFGYNVDSIKDKKIFKACRKAYAELRKFFGVNFQTFLSCVSE